MKKNPSLKTRSTAPFLQAIFSLRSTNRNLWLGLAILALGAFGNSVQAAVWLSDSILNLSSYAADAALNTTTSPNLITSRPTYTVITANSVKKIRAYKPAGTGVDYASTITTASHGRATFKLSTVALNTTDRSVGYLSFKIAPNSSMVNVFESNIPNSSNLEIGLGTTGTDEISGNLNFFFSGKFYYNPNGAVPTFRFYHSGVTLVSSAYTSLNSGENTVKIWYNKSGSLVSYTPPGLGAVLTNLNPNSFVAYVNDTIAPGFTPAGVTVTSFTAATTLPTGTTGTGLLTVGKLGLVHGATKNTYDFVVNDIFVADSAPLAIVSSATASASVGTAFNYTISTTATSGTRTFGIDPATPLPANLTLNTTTGQITGAPTTVGTYPITLTATDGTTSATTTLTITVTAAATVYRWNNLGNDWSSAGSWDNGGTAPATSALIDTAAFGSDGSGATSVNVGSGNTIKGIVFSNNAYAYTWTGTDIKVLSSGAITNSSSVAQTFGNKIINSSGNATWSSAANGSMVFNGGIDLSDSSTNNTLTFAGAGNATVGGAIANGGGSTAGAVTFTSTGTNLLSGGNMYGGLTTMNAAGGGLWPMELQAVPP